MPPEEAATLSTNCVWLQRTWGQTGRSKEKTRRGRTKLVVSEGSTFLYGREPLPLGHVTVIVTINTAFRGHRVSQVTKTEVFHRRRGRILVTEMCFQLRRNPGGHHSERSPSRVNQRPLLGGLHHEDAPLRGRPQRCHRHQHIGMGPTTAEDKGSSTCGVHKEGDLPLTSRAS